MRMYILHECVCMYDIYTYIYEVYTCKYEIPSYTYVDTSFVG